MALNHHPHTYLLIADIFRDWYRAGYMQETLHYGCQPGTHNSKDTKSLWPPLVYSLQGIVSDDCPDKNIIDKSFIKVSFMEMSNEIWAANCVAPQADGSRWGMIYVNKRLYEEVYTSREEAEKRKFILAHEWLEVLYVLCNHDKITNGRAIAKRAEMFALMGAAEMGLPWQDTEDHLALMVPALRDLLVSTGSIKKLCTHSKFVDSFADLENRFLGILRQEGSNPAITLLQRISEEISPKINVARSLVLSRIEEALKIPHLNEWVY